MSYEDSLGFGAVFSGLEIFVYSQAVRLAKIKTGIATFKAASVITVRTMKARVKIPLMKSPLDFKAF